MLIMLLTVITLMSTCMQNIIWILLVHNLFLAANVCKYTVRYAVRLLQESFQKLVIIKGFQGSVRTL